MQELPLQGGCLSVNFAPVTAKPMRSVTCGLKLWVSISGLFCLWRISCYMRAGKGPQEHHFFDGGEQEPLITCGSLGSGNENLTRVFCRSLIYTPQNFFE